mgnify:CR=1 FL=1
MPFINTEHIQAEYRAALIEAGEALIAYFGGRLLAIYLTGSIMTGDALPGVSDVDWFMFITGEPTEEESAWCRELARDITTRYPAVVDFHLTPYPLARLEGDSFWRFAVRHRAIRLYGRDLPAVLEARGLVVDAPSREMAIGRQRGMHRILTPSRDICLQRDQQRPCWTAGPEYVDQWYDEFQAMRRSHPAWCLDTSEETVEETVARHFHGLLRYA